MRQQSLTDGFEKHRKRTRKKQFPVDINTIISWSGLVGTIEPHHAPKRWPSRHRH